MIKKASEIKAPLFSQMKVIVPIVCISSHVFYNLDLIKKIIVNLPDNSVLTQCLLKDVQNIYLSVREADIHDQIVEAELMLLNTYSIPPKVTEIISNGIKRKVRLQDRLIFSGSLTKGSIRLHEEVYYGPDDSGHFKKVLVNNIQKVC